MKDTLNNELIKAMRERLPEEVNLANQIMDIISIGKEAVYRRLRGEVPFTFYEVSLIAQQLGLSLDLIVGANTPGSTICRLNLLHSPDPLENYVVLLNRYINGLNYVKDEPEGILHLATNVIPFIFYAPYRNITKFRVCRWIHQTNGMKPVVPMGEFVYPDKVVELHTRIVNLVRTIPAIYTIWDTHIFKSLVNEIKYFSGLNVLSEADRIALKNELLQLLDELETVAAKGAFSNGQKVFIYLSNINFESSYGLLEKKNYQVSLYNLYAIHMMDSQHPDICRVQKEWIVSLRRYSTLISQSGEIQRMIFFNEQREIINTL
ncbi:MAG: hypothetical protein LUD74_08150 [Tannerellaceae bacterium]|nr:hypothetical protein [Tannerellaceae bacterium]